MEIISQVHKSTNTVTYFFLLYILIKDNNKNIKKLFLTKSLTNEPIACKEPKHCFAKGMREQKMQQNLIRRSYPSTGLN